MAIGRARTLLLLAGLACLALLAGPTAGAAARSCEHPKLKVSKRVVQEGSSVIVRGRTCKGGGGKVQIHLKAGKRWRVIDRTRPRRNGKFRERVRITRTEGHRKARLRASFSRRKSRAIPVKIIDQGDCALDRPGTEIGMTLTGCRLVASDTATGSPLSFWGFLACQNSSRVGLIDGDGDTHATATGEGQGNSSFRRTTVLDGDDPFGWGERCELGENDHQVGPTAFYREGQRRVTYVSMRLPDNFPIDANAWQTVLQMKEAQPYDNSLYCCPILFMGAFNNQWKVDSNNGRYWTFPAQRNVWTRFIFDVTYSADPQKGSLQVSADLNADGDVDDEGERMPRIRTNTLIAETDGPNGLSDGLAPGESIPSHLRAGLYHNSSIPCPAPVGCSTEIDNVQVVAP